MSTEPTAHFVERQVAEVHGDDVRVLTVSIPIARDLGKENTRKIAVHLASEAVDKQWDE